MKRRGRGRWSRLALGLGGLVVLGTVAAVWWSATGWDVVERVEVNGTSRLSLDQVRMWAGVPRGVGLWALDPRPITVRLQRRPWIKTVTVHKRFPHMLVLDVVERVPIAIATTDQGTPWRAPVWIDDEGVVLDVSSADRGLPLIRGATAKRPDGLVEAAQVLTAFRAMDTSLFPVDSLIVDVSSPEDLTVLLPNATRVRFGQGDYVEKWRQYLRIHTDIARRIPGTRVVDLRFQDRAVVTGG